MDLLLSIAIFFVMIVWAIVNYNKLWTYAETVRSRRANILVATKKRADLAQRLVDIARNYGDHEKLAQLKISEDMTTIAGMASVNHKTNLMLNQVASLAMAFPELKANETFQHLMSQIASIENEIMNRRESYNVDVASYNAFRAGFPRVLVANAFQFEPAPYYEISEEGLDVLSEFRTGDTALISDVFRRASDRAQDFGAYAGQKLAEGQRRLKEQQERLESERRSADGSADSSASNPPA